MKIVILTGGLGNQMFQYAFYLSLKAKGIKCKLDTTLFHVSDMHNGYELRRVFGIKDGSESAPNPFHKLWIRILYKFKPGGLVYNDKCYHYCDDVYCARQKYLNGCWINASYFGSVKGEIKSAFVFSNIDSMNISIANEMNQVNSVALHIRRGDYLANPMYNVCNESYYRKAIEYLISKVSSPFFYIFSDDLLWSELLIKQYGIKYRVINNNRGVDNYKDMYLMSQCKHNIIANSTFSWWGAWLNENLQKIVVAPSCWTIDNKMEMFDSNWYQI